MALRMKAEKGIANKILAIISIIVGAIILFFGVMFLVFAPTADPTMIMMALLFILAGLFDVWFGYDRMKWQKVQLQVTA